MEGNYFVAAYPPFSCWTRDSIGQANETLNTQPDSVNHTPLGLYIHIPFCEKRCDYCYYLSFDDKLHQAPSYIDAVIHELSIYAHMPAIAGRKPTFIYVGGGTPSILSARQIQKLLEGLQTALPWDHIEEATFECAPKTVTANKLKMLRQAGITRLSIGAQQLNDDILRANGRVHLTDDIYRAFARARDAAFPVINLDLIVGLVHETDATFYASLEQVIELAPESVTIYQLEIPLNTPLYKQLSSQSHIDSSKTPPIADWNKKRRRLVQAFSILEDHGYNVASGYSAVRDLKKHRFVYQQDQYHGADLLGLGAASFSYLAGTHYQNRTSLESYMKCLDRGTLPIERAYALSDSERETREFLLQLKLGRLSIDYFRRKFGIEIGEQFEKPLKRCIGLNWLTIQDDNILLTREGLLRVDRIIPEFYPDQFRVARYS